MKNKILIGLIVVGFVGTAFFAYIGIGIVRARYYPTEHEKRFVKRLQSIIINNDTGDTVFAEFTKDGQVMNDYCETDGFILDTQGKVRIFVPKAKGNYLKGWYTIEYPYPYPLTKNTSWLAVRPYAVDVKLTDILHSLGLKAGLVNYADPIPVKFGLWEDTERTLVHDIKVTFEPGEGPKGM